MAAGKSMGHQPVVLYGYAGHRFPLNENWAQRFKTRWTSAEHCEFVVHQFPAVNDHPIAPEFFVEAVKLSEAVKQVTAALKAMSAHSKAPSNSYDVAVYQAPGGGYLFLYHRLRVKFTTEIETRDDRDYTFKFHDMQQFVLDHLPDTTAVTALEAEVMLPHHSWFAGVYTEHGYILNDKRGNRHPTSLAGDNFYFLSAMDEVLAPALKPFECGVKPSLEYKAYVTAAEVKSLVKAARPPGASSQIGIDLYDGSVFLRNGEHFKQLTDAILADDTPDYTKSISYAAHVLAKVGPMWYFKLYDEKNGLHLHTEPPHAHIDRRLPSVIVKVVTGKKITRKQTPWLSLFERSTIPVGFTRVAFYPARNQIAAGTLNLWQGWTFAHHEAAMNNLTMDKIRNPEGPVQEILRFVFTYLSGGVPHLFWGMIHWFASIVQRPWQKTGRLLQITGDMGCGKSTFISFIFKVLGAAHCLTVTKTSEIVGGWNSHFMAKVIVELSEACTKFEPAAQQELKALITEAKINVNEKFCTLKTGMDSFVNIVMTSNLVSPMIHEAGKGPDRRALVVSALPVPAEIKDALFNRLTALYDNDEVCLQFGFMLANLDLTLWDHRVRNFVFDSDEYQKQKHDTLPPAPKLISSLIRAGKNLHKWETGDGNARFVSGLAVRLMSPAFVHPTDPHKNAPQTDPNAFHWYLDCSFTDWVMWAISRAGRLAAGKYPQMDEITREIVTLGCTTGDDDRLTFPPLAEMKANFYRHHGINLDVIDKPRPIYYNQEKRDVMRWYLELDQNGNPRPARSKPRRREGAVNRMIGSAESQQISISRANSFANPAKFTDSPGTPPTNFAAFNASLSRTPLDPRDRISSPGKVNPLHTNEEIPDSQEDDFSTLFGHSDSDEASDNSSVGGRDLMDE